MTKTREMGVLTARRGDQFQAGNGIMPTGNRLRDETSRTEGLRVLLVDDCPDIVTSMALVLQLCGHQVQIAFSGPEALSLARHHPPDVVLCDIAMPGMSGLEVARQLREMFCKRVLLVAITARSSEEDRRLCQEAGFDHHFVKPANPTEVQALLEEACHGLPSDGDEGQGTKSS